MGRKSEHLYNEVYSSMHEDVNQLATIGGKCFVLSEEAYKNTVPTEDNNIGPGGKPLYYICRKAYDCFNNKILDISEKDKRPAKKRRNE